MLILAFIVCIVSVTNAGDINRQSIVFYDETPEVFYCPQEKPISLEGMIVKAKPLKKLCEYEGRPLPSDYKSDCWNDVDETEYACKEKRRILLKLKPPGWENGIIDNYVPILRKGEYKIVSEEEIERRMMKKEKEQKEEIRKRKEQLKIREPKNDF